MTRKTTGATINNTRIQLLHIDWMVRSGVTHEWAELTGPKRLLSSEWNGSSPSTQQWPKGTRTREGPAPMTGGSRLTTSPSKPTIRLVSNELGTCGCRNVMMSSRFKLVPLSPRSLFTSTMSCFMHDESGFNVGCMDLPEILTSPTT